MDHNSRRKFVRVEVDEGFLVIHLSDGAGKIADIDLIELGYRKVDTAIAAHIDNGRITLTLYDGRIISTPLEWYPQLRQLTPEELKDFELFPTGPYWGKINSRVTVEDMLKGTKY